MTHIKQDGTKGVLNYVCEKYGCNQKRKTVAINNLIRYHKPVQQAELVALIASHAKGGKHENCECGCKSAGTIKDFADNLYVAFKDFRNTAEGYVEHKNWEDCYIFMKHLFVIGALRGNDMENSVTRDLNFFFNNNEHDIVKLCRAEIASEVNDFKYSVDISIYDDNNVEIFGVQVKPVTYKNFKPSHRVVKHNLQKNRAYNRPVIYIYYDENNMIVDAASVSQALYDTIYNIHINK